MEGEEEMMGEGEGAVVDEEDVLESVSDVSFEGDAEAERGGDCCWLFIFESSFCFVCAEVDLDVVLGCTECVEIRRTAFNPVRWKKCELFWSIL